MSHDITSLRQHLFDAIAGVKAGTLGLDEARAINELGKTITDTSKVEVDYLRAIGGGESQFIGSAAGDGTGSGQSVPPLPPGITGRTVHRLKG